MTPALGVLLLTFVVAIALGLLARRGHAMSLEQWSLGGRGFGTVFVFLLMAGEIYTTFTFLGGSGWAYGKGAPAFYILCYAPIAYCLSYFLLPAVRRYAQPRGLVSQADFFEAKYESQALGVLVAIVGVVALVPYLVLQLRGLGIIVSEVSGGTVSATAAVWAGTVALVFYVVVSGIRGSAWTAALKDVLILAVAIAIGVYLPSHYYGGVGPMFAAIERARPGFLTLPAAGMSLSWFVSTVILTSLGLLMWPHTFASAYTARSDVALRRNAVLLPLYQLVILFVFFAGFAAVLVVPGLAGADADLSLLRISARTFSPWTVGVIGAAGLLTALVPGSMLLISGATIFAQNVYRPIVRTASDRTIALVARGSVPVIATIAAIFAEHGGQTIVTLLLLGYAIVTQLAPALLASFGRARWATSTGAIAGICAGEATAVYLTLPGAPISALLPGAPQIMKDLNVGAIALAVNVAVLVVVSLAMRRPGGIVVPGSAVLEAARSPAARLT